jgi:hypothetical protein
VLSNFAVRMPVHVFAMVMGALPTFHTRSAEVHEFARERKSVVPILNKLNDFIAREMSKACMYQKVAVTLVEGVYYVKGEEAEFRFVVFTADQR